MVTKKELIKQKQLLVNQMNEKIKKSQLNISRIADNMGILKRSTHLDNQRRAALKQEIKALEIENKNQSKELLNLRNQIEGLDNQIRSLAV